MGRGKRKSDTLKFLLIDGNERLYLARGSEIRNNVSRPKNKSGLYQYRIEGDSIRLSWILSSKAGFTGYFFSKSNDTIRIENFYEPDAAGRIETFKYCESC